MRVEQTDTFRKWLGGLEDRAGRARVLVRIDRLIGGNPGQHRQLAGGVSELKIDVGPVWLVGEMTDAAALAALKPDMSALAEWTTSLGATGVTVFAPSGEPDCALHVRSFAPAGGVPEDPVCGSGNISVAAYLRHFERASRAYVARQGMQLGRDGRVYMRVEGEDIWLGGEAVAVVDGTLSV